MAGDSCFCFPVPDSLQNIGVKLVPFRPDRHSASFMTQAHNRQDLFAHMPTGPFRNTDEFAAEFQRRGSVLNFEDPSGFTFAIIDKTRPPSPEDEDGELAGMVSYICASEIHRSLEVGVIITLPAYQRTHVTRNAVGLVLHYALDLPEHGGLGLHRVAWQCSQANHASARVGEVMGFEPVGLIPYHFRFPKGKLRAKIGNGKEPPPGTDADDLWRDTMMYTMSWDVWERVVKAKIQSIMKSSYKRRI